MVENFNTDFGDRFARPEFGIMVEEITLDHADLGRAEPEFDIHPDDLKLFDKDGSIAVKVFVDGQSAELVKTSARTIIAKAPITPAETILTVVVTTRQERIINELAYDVREKQFRKSRDEARGDEAALIKAIGDAAQKIADAMARSNSKPPTRDR